MRRCEPRPGRVVLVPASLSSPCCRALRATFLGLPTRPLPLHYSLTIAVVCLPSAWSRRAGRCAVMNSDLVKALRTEYFSAQPLFPVRVRHGRHGIGAPRHKGKYPSLLLRSGLNIGLRGSLSPIGQSQARVHGRTCTPENIRSRACMYLQTETEPLTTKLRKTTTSGVEKRHSKRLHNPTRCHHEKEQTA